MIWLCIWHTRDYGTISSATKTWWTISTASQSDTGCPWYVYSQMDGHLVHLDGHQRMTSAPDSIICWGNPNGSVIRGNKIPESIHVDSTMRVFTDACLTYSMAHKMYWRFYLIFIDIIVGVSVIHLFYIMFSEIFLFELHTVHFLIFDSLKQ